MTIKKTIKTTKKTQFRVFHRLPNGKRITKVFQKKSDADKFRIELKYEKQRHLNSGVSINNHITFSEFANEWFEMEVKGRKSLQTQRTYLNDLKHFIVPVIGEVKLRDLNIRHARLIENRMLEKEKHPRTINKAMTVLKTILNDAVKSDHLIKNPLRGYSELREPPKTIKFWTKEEVEIFLEHTKEHPLFDFFVTTLNTGMRLGEVLGLKWDKVDFLNNQIVVSRCLGRDGLRDTTKTHEVRFIPMNKRVRTILEKLFKTRINDSFVFCKSSGDHLDYNHINQRYFLRAQKEVGIIKIIRFHDLRHTFASHFMMNGGNIYTLQKILGHKDIQTTMIYAHLDSDFLQKEILLINF